MLAQVEAAGTVGQLVDVLRDKYRRPVPGADLPMSDPYKELMPEVTEIKDLGSGVIRGVECDHLAFRTREVDWQIWIAQGPNPLSPPLQHHQQEGDRRAGVPARHLGLEDRRPGRCRSVQAEHPGRRPEAHAGKSPGTERHSRHLQGRYG
jgi:hypothetical protein